MKLTVSDKGIRRPLSIKPLLIMKMTALLILAAILQVSAKTFSQSVTIKVEKAKLTQVFKIISQQTGYEFLANPALLEHARPVSITVQNKPLEPFLSGILSDQGLTYSIINRIIVVKKANPVVTYQPGNTIPPVIAVPPTEYIMRGRVSTISGEPLQGAAVRIKDTKKGTLTNAIGVFSIPYTEPSATIEISFTGYTTYTVTITSDKFLSIFMAPSQSDLDEVQTTAYGKTSKRLNTGSVFTIKAEEIEKNPVPNVLQAIQGRVPGLFITQQTGLPGGAFDVQIRSRTTFGTQIQQPLYIVDGVAYPANGTLPLTSSTYGGATAQGDNPLHGGNALNYLDPSMIESINVLQGADATAIYGSRGAYGVILITTKKGKAGKPRFMLNTYSGVSVRGTAPKLLNTQQYLMLRHEALKNDGTAIRVTDYDLNGTWDTTSYTNWQKVFTGKPALTTKLNASYSGGTENTSFLIGASYNYQQNVQKGKGSDKSGGMNFNITSSTNNKKFTIVLSGSFTSDLNDMVPFDFSTDGATTQAPDAPSLFLPDGSLNWSTGSNAAAALNILYKNTTNNLTANTALKYMPVKGLTINATIGYNLLSAKEFKGYPTPYFNPANSPATQTTSTLNYYSIRTITADPNINYTATAGKLGKISITAGGTLQDRQDDNHSITGTNFLSDAMLYNPASAPQANISTFYNLTPARYGGYFAIINYNWNNRYILDFNGRRDGSTKFGPGKQFGNFGSAGAAWIFSEEKWFKRNVPFINFAKLKGSYGTLGGDGIGNYSYLSTYNLNSGSYQGNPGLYPTAIANPNLQWETNKAGEIGLSLDFLKSRISFDGIYYTNQTSNQLASQSLSSITGFTSYTYNSPAVIKTNGWELMLTTQNFKSAKFSWTSILNVTIPHSKLAYYPGNNATSLSVNYIVGKPITGVVLYKYDGVDPQTGNYNFTNKAGTKGTFTPFTSSVQLAVADKTEFVDLSPKYYGGFQNTLNYKNFTLNFLFSFTSRMGKNYLGQQTYGPGFANKNTTTSSLGRWQKPGDIASVQKASAGIIALFTQNNFISSTGAYSNATYARLTNLNLAYNFSGKFLQRASISALSVYIAGQNVLTISKYGDLDPENLGAGNMPPLRIFTGGINITF